MTLSGEEGPIQFPEGTTLQAILWLGKLVEFILQFHSFSAVLKLGISCVWTVAKRFVIRPTASAKGHSISTFVGTAIGGDDWNTSPYPQRSAAPFFGILNDPNGFNQTRLYLFPVRFFNCDQSARRTISNLTNKIGSNLRFISMFHLVPHSSMRIAKARESAQVFCVSELHYGSFHEFSLFQNRTVICGFSAVKVNLRMVSITKWFYFRLSTSAEGVFGGSWNWVAWEPSRRLAVSIGFNGLICEAHRATDEIRSILRYSDLFFNCHSDLLLPFFCPVASVHTRNVISTSMPFPISSIPFKLRWKFQRLMGSLNIKWAGFQTKILKYTETFR